MNKENSQGSLISIKIEGSSMSPLIKEGDTVLARYLDWQKARIGDILAYERPGDGHITVHRLVKILNRGDKVLFISQGDANASYCCDEPFDPRACQLKKVVVIVKKNSILYMENRWWGLKCYCKALLLWYFPFLIHPCRKLRKALFFPFSIKGEATKNTASLIKRFKNYFIIFLILSSAFQFFLPVLFSAEPEDTINLYRRQLETDPNDITILLKLGEVYSDHRRHVEALEIFYKVLKLQPESSLGHEYLAWIYSQIGALNISIKEYEESIVLLEKEIEKLTSTLESKNRLVVMIYRFCGVLEKAGMKDMAISQYLKLRSLLDKEPRLQQAFSFPVIPNIEKQLNILRQQTNGYR